MSAGALEIFSPSATSIDHSMYQGARPMLFRPRDAKSAAVVLLLSITLAATQSDQPGPSTTVVVRTAQELSDQIAVFGAEGGTMTVLLAADTLDMHGVTFWTANNSLPGRFSNGTLILIGQPPSGAAATVINSAGREGLAPVFTGSARLQLINITMVNNGERYYVLNKAGTRYSTAYNVELFRRSQLYASHTYIDFTIYSRIADLALWQYQGIMLVAGTIFPEVYARVGRLLPDVSAAQNTYTLWTSYSYSTTFTQLPAATVMNCTLATTRDPDDPLLNQMRADHTLMPPQWTNGTLLPPEMADADVNTEAGPLYFSADADFATQLPKAANLSAYQDTTGGPTAPITLAGIANLTADSFPQTLVIPGDLFVLGVRGKTVVTEAPGFGLIDFNNRESVLKVETGAKLFMVAIVLQGLAVRQNPPSVSSSLPINSSALPLAAIATASDPQQWASNPQIRLYNVRIGLPQLDYLAMLLLALQPTADISACMDNITIAHAAQLAPNVYVMQYAASDLQLQWFTFSNFTGFGMSGSNVRFFTQQPLPPTITNLCVATMQAAMVQESNKNEAGRIAGIVVGSVVGFAGTLAVAALVVKVLRRHSSRLDSFTSKPKQTYDPVLINCKNGSPRCGFPALRSLTKSSDPRCMPLSDAATPTGSPGAANTGTPEMDSTADIRTYVTGGNRKSTSLWQLVRDSQQLHNHQAGFNEPGLVDNPLYSYSAVTPTVAPTSDANMAAMRAAMGDDQSRNIPSTSVGSLGRGTTSHLSMSSYVPSLDTQSSISHPISQPSMPSQDVIVLSHASITDPTAAASEPAVKIRNQRMAVRDRDPDKVIIKEVLGKGAGGTVCAGEWRGMPVAVKTVVFYWNGTNPAERPWPYLGYGSQKKFEPQPIIEAAIAASVGHPNLVATYCYDIKPVKTITAGDDAGSLKVEERFSANIQAMQVSRREYKMYLIQELCGCSVAHALENGMFEHNGLPLCPQAVGILHVLIDIAQGLAYLHGKGVVHGDLKPDNVLLKISDSSPTGVIAKLTDFGLSTYLNEGTHVSNYQAGTPFYVAPEVVTQFRVSPASDIYSFGVMMWQLWTGQAPFVRHETTGQLSRNPRFGVFTLPKPPAWYHQLFMRCMSIEPRQRPSATDVITGITMGLCSCMMEAQ